MLKATNLAEQHKGKAYLSAVSKVNQSALAHGATMQDPEVLDSLYIQGFGNIDALIKQHGVLTDAQVWRAVSPVILNHVKDRIETDDTLRPSSATVAINTMSAQTGIPVDMVMPTWNSLKAHSNGKVSFEALSNHYQHNMVGILSQTLGYPHEALQPLVSELKASGVRPSLTTVIPHWQKKARQMPTHWA
jgi:hypothetical protein